ncbi:RxLR effector protein [Phytophthora megakarya]|uniref:RxLR effector protein n=1 Tax=Phytophthora megakarya TaxID=4795 RepID=A0A225UK41_9STRA|nr:RxLR effector protein [Phytophthora megakarya]
MRGIFYIALAMAILTCNNAVATNEVELSSKTTPEFVKGDGVEPRKRFLRVNHKQDGDLSSQFEQSEERDKASGLKKIAKELRLRRQGGLKLTATAQIVKAKQQQQRLNTLSKEFKPVSGPIVPAKIESKAVQRFNSYLKNKVPGETNSVTLQRFEKFFSRKQTPDTLESTGILKNGMADSYRIFYNEKKAMLAKLASAKHTAPKIATAA